MDRGGCMKGQLGKKLIEMVQDPYEWYNQKSFDSSATPKTIFQQMLDDPCHLMRVETGGEFSFFGGYTIGFALREGLGVRDLLLQQPKTYQYLDLFRFAQCMEIHPDVLPETISPSGIKTRPLLERVQVGNSLLLRIPLGNLAYLSLPAVRNASLEDITLGELVKKYRLTGNELFRREYLTRAKSIVKEIVFRKFQSATKASGDERELIDLGIEGAQDAFDKFDLERGIKLETYLPDRVRGSILDALREIDDVPRLVRKVSAEMKPIIQEAAGRGIQLSVEEVEKRLSNSKYSSQTIEYAYRLAVTLKGDLKSSMDFEQTSAKSGKTFNLGERIPGRASDSLDPARIFGAKDSVKLLLSCLSREDQEIIVRYYLRGETMLEIGEALGISESWVSMRHTALMPRLREIAELRGIDSFI